MRGEYLPFCLPFIGNEEKKEIADTLNSGWLTTGPKTKMFEEKICSYIGSKHAIAVNSCTSALHLCLISLGIGHGDEVITSPFTFAATSNVIIHQKAKPVFVDIKKDTFNIDPCRIEEKINSATKAIIPVHYAGQPCEMATIMDIAKRHNLFVVEDAAHAIGAKYRRKSIGTIGDATCFSFYATKNITTGEGGMITTENSNLAEKLNIYKLHGMQQDAWKRYSKAGSWLYDIVYPGYKYNMTDLEASLGLHQTDRLEEFIQIREKYAQIYDRAFQRIDGVEPPFVKKRIKHARHLYPILVDINTLRIDRARFIEQLRKCNIGSTVNFIPMHLHTFYKESYGYCRGDFPNAEWVYDRIISLPLYPKMSIVDVEDVIEAVELICARNKR
jgi:dTDP-4-amino-4,6-dideoxygalactose transaminase